MTLNEKAVAPKDPEVQDAQFFAAIGYLSFLCFVPLALKRENKFALFHGKQALVLFIMDWPRQDPRKILAPFFWARTLFGVNPSAS